MRACVQQGTYVLECMLHTSFFFGGSVCLPRISTAFPTTLHIMHLNCSSCCCHRRLPPCKPSAAAAEHLYFSATKVYRTTLPRQGCNSCSTEYHTGVVCEPKCVIEPIEIATYLYQKYNQRKRWQPLTRSAPLHPLITYSYLPSGMNPAGVLPQRVAKETLPILTLLCI